MSSSPPTRSADRIRRWLARRSLRLRLIAVLVGALAVICLIVGTVTVAALHTLLVGQLDEQVRADSARVADYTNRPVRPGGPAPPDEPWPGGLANPGQARGLPPGTVTAVISGSGVDLAARQSDTAEPEPLPAALAAVLAEVPADGRVHTRELGDYGTYRVTAVPNGSGDVVVTGLPLSDVDDTRWLTVLVLTGVSLAGLLVTGVVGALVVRRTLRPLERVASTAAEVTALPLDQGDVALPVRVPGADPGTEVGRVAEALNRMLRHVGQALAARQASESRVRRFVADASHELRTPLAAIRGYAELAGRYGATVPDDVRHAVDRVEAEATRMTGLVEELLLLATLDEQRPLASRPVDLSRLVVDAVTDAQVAGAQHHWRLELPTEPITVAGDAGQLHQAITNLLANARNHTPAGTTVTTRVAVSGGKVRLSVTDDGPGVPTSLLPEVFERFVRADPARSRQAGGSGLGLAIAAGVVAAHGGEVAVESMPGRTVFTVLLPPEPGPSSPACP